MLYQIHEGNMSPMDKIVQMDSYSYISVITVSEALQYFQKLLPQTLAVRILKILPCGLKAMSSSTSCDCPCSVPSAILSAALPSMYLFKKILCS